MPEISVMIEGGKATAAAPLGPALGPLGVNIGEIVAKINEKTKDYAGMKVPVKVIIDSATKGFEIEIGSPPISALIKKELGLEKGAANPKTESVGNLSMEQVKKIAGMKMENLSSYKLKSAVKEVIGSCDSIGVTIEGKKARQMQKEIENGKYDSVLEEGSAVEEAPKEEPKEQEKENQEEIKEEKGEEVKEEDSSEENKVEEEAEEEKKEEQKEEAVEEKQNEETEAKEEAPKEESVKEENSPEEKGEAAKESKKSYTQHMKEIEAETRVEKGVEEKKKVETETSGDLNTEITKPKK